MLSPSHTISSHRHLSFARLYTHEKFPYTVKLYCIKIRVHSVHCKASSTCALFWVTQLRRRTFSFRRHWFSRQASQSTCMRAFSLSYFGSREVTASETRTFIIKKTNQGLLYQITNPLEYHRFCQMVHVVSFALTGNEKKTSVKTYDWNSSILPISSSCCHE